MTEPKIEVLAATKFGNLVKVKVEGTPITGYIYLQDTRGGQVAILPFRRIEDGEIEYLLRSELCPAWSVTMSHWTCITGGIEGKDTIAAALLELHEEAGIEIKMDADDFHDRVLHLGQVMVLKAADYTYDLFAVDVTDLPQEEPKGDGSKLETDFAHNTWMDREDAISNAGDSLVYALMMRLDAEMLSGVDHAKVALHAKKP